MPHVQALGTLLGLLASTTSGVVVRWVVGRRVRCLRVVGGVGRGVVVGGGGVASDSMKLASLVSW